MLGWFRPLPPCDRAAKKWVEERLQWLSEQFGLHVLLEKPIILPIADFFPDPWDGSRKAVRSMFRRVCEYMGVDPDDVDLKFFNDKAAQGLNVLDPSLGFSAGTWSGRDGPWQRGVVRLEKSTLDQPMGLVGTMAHELAHQRLLGEGRVTHDSFDNELLTDLTAVFHGFGVFLANNPRKSTGELGFWPGSKLRKPEYLSEPMLAYALAHIAWHRDDQHSTWAKHLRWAPRAAFKQSFRHLQKTGDSTLKPVRMRFAD